MTADVRDDDRRIQLGNSAIMVIRAAAATLSAVAIIAFQSEFLGFFHPLLAGDQLLWPAIYYGYWTLTVCFTVAVLVTDPAVRRQSLPVLLVCLLMIALTFIHPLDWMAKNLVVAMMLLICVTVLILGSAPLLLLRLSAAVTTLSAVICCLDILFDDGLTNTAGRAAGLAVNPNDAAAGLFIGAAATWWAVPKRWRVPFLLLNGAAIFFTLSRSTLLAALVVVCGVGALSMWQMMRNGDRPRLDGAPSGRTILVALGLLIWGSVALSTNDRFVIAATDSFGGLRGALSAFEDASRSVQTAMQALTVQRKSAATSEGAPQAAHVDAQIDAIGKVSENEGEKNSVSARALFMWRAFITYGSGPFFGRGLAAAHEIAPHNTFLLFAVAFGHVGWLMPFAFIGLTFYRVRNAGQLPLGLATTAVLMTGNDILFPSFIVAIAVGIAGNISRQSAAKVCHYSLAALRGVVIAGSICFIIGCSAVIVGFDRYMTARLGDGVIAINQSSGPVFAAPIPRPGYGGILRLAEVASQHSTGRPLFLLEDGKVLSDAQAPDAAAMALKNGQYLIWRRKTLLFSTSDNSDPRVNGRAYEIRTPISIHPLILLVLSAILIWCLVVVSRLRDAPAE